MIENIETFVLESPAIVALLTISLILGYHYQKGLTYTEYIKLHQAKTLLFQTLDDYARAKGRPLIRTKAYRNGEYLETVEKTGYDVSRELREYGFNPHLFATVKRRVDPHTGNYEYAHSQWVYYHDNSQTEVYLFYDPEKKTTDVYAHHEGQFTNVEDHLTGKQIAGDPKGVVREALE